MNVSPVFKVTRHAFRAFHLLYVAVVLSVISVFVELAAMTSLFPLAEMAVGRDIPPQGLWARFAALFPGQAPVPLFLSFFLALLFLRVGTAAVVTLLNASLFRRMIAHFSANAFEAFVKHLSFGQIQKKTIGHFITLAGDEANRASQIVLAIVRLVPITLLATLYLVALFVHSRWIGLAVLVFLGSMGIGMMGAFRRSHELGSRQQSESRDLNTFFLDALSGLRTVRGFNAEGYTASRYRQMINQYARTCFSVDSVNILGRTLPALLLLAGGILGVSVWLDEGTLTKHLAFTLAATVIVLRFLPLVGQALDTFMRLAADLRAGQHIANVVDIPQSAAPAAAGTGFPKIVPIREIEFKCVTFSYSDETAVLRDFSAVFKSGRTYAVAGPSGSGKSTLVDLLLGFYAPTSGQISVNGVGIERLDSHEIRSRIGIVEQQARLLSDTVRNNLAFGRSAGVLELEQAVRTARLEDVLASLPAGLDSLVSFQGSNLSGGQRQRISIARALVKRVDVLILDEGTNGLDAETRDRIVANLRELYRDRLLIFLTHDKDVISQVDEVVTLEKSKAPGTDDSYLSAIGQDYPRTA